ncbi:hypothetical protein TNCV_4738351 [Trichonephila clavipes]|nr:hypothetical protein TNCV_4738351 [Trichonephila clavipes]
MEWGLLEQTQLKLSSLIGTLAQQKLPFQVCRKAPIDSIEPNRMPEIPEILFFFENQTLDHVSHGDNHLIVVIRLNEITGIFFYSLLLGTGNGGLFLSRKIQ